MKHETCESKVANEKKAQVRKCAVKGCERNATIGGIVVGTKDVLLELCDYHHSQFERK